MTLSVLTTKTQSKNETSLSPFPLAITETSFDPKKVIPWNSTPDTDPTISNWRDPLYTIQLSSRRPLSPQWMMMLFDPILIGETDNPEYDDRSKKVLGHKVKILPLWDLLYSSTASDKAFQSEKQEAFQVGLRSNG